MDPVNEMWLWDMTDDLQQTQHKQNANSLPSLPIRPPPAEKHMQRQASRKSR